MALARITASEFEEMIADGIDERDPTLDTAYGPVKDLRISPIAEVLEFQSNRIVYVSELTSLKNVDKLVPDDLDDYVYNEGMVRWGGSRSTTTLTFARSQAPTASITVPINFPVATKPDPATGRTILFRTVETKTMNHLTPNAYYNADTEKYELDVAVSSILTGDNTSVGSYTINVMKRSITGFEEIYNKTATTSGRSIETNAELATRYLLHIEGSQLGTPTGVKSYVLDNFSSVTDAYVVYGNSDYMTREQDDAGAVDVWILGETPLNRTQQSAYPGVETLMVLDRQPLISITSVVSGATTFVEGTDYEVVSDTGAYYGSTRGQDGIRFLSGGTVPTNIGDTVNITYQYNSLISTLTSYFTQSVYYSMGMDKLFRAAEQVNVELEGSLSVNAGSPDRVRNAVYNSIYSYINNLSLGQPLEIFDVLAEASRNVGVDNLIFTTCDLKGGSGASDLTAAPYEYFRIAESDLIINVV